MVKWKGLLVVPLSPILDHPDRVVSSLKFLIIIIKNSDADFGVDLAFVCSEQIIFISNKQDVCFQNYSLLYCRSLSDEIYIW
jgi:hypothetical protein